MIIKDSIVAKGPTVPPCLQKHITQKTTCQLTDAEIQAFQKAYFLLSIYIDQHPLKPEVLCIVILSDQDSITLCQEEDTLGQHVSLATYWLQNIRPKLEAPGKIQEDVLLLLVLEELCHALYQIQDEHYVKEVVFDIVKPYNTGLTLHRVYPDMFDENDHRIVS